MYDIIINIITGSWGVLGQMAPYLLFGFLVAGFLSVCISPEWVERHLGGRGLGPVLKASLFGVPLPLCSCGVIPVSASIYRHGASRAATTAFLLSTPQTGVDSIAVTYALLGPIFAIFRPIAALLTGLIGGGIVQFFGEPNGTDVGDKSKPAPCNESCCAGKTGKSVLLRVLRYGFVILPRDIGLALLVGIFIAGAMAAIVPQDHLATYIGGGVLSILLLMAAGVPVYVCATASVPIAAGFIHIGVSPGAALAFLIAGPATNAATFTTIWKLLGRRTAILYITTIAVSAFGCGLLLDWLFPMLKETLPMPEGSTHAHLESGWLSHVWAIALVAVLAMAYLMARPGSHEKTEKDKCNTDISPHYQHLELLITGMTCNHCAESVRDAIAEVSGVRSAEVNLKSGRAIVMGDNLDQKRLMAAVEGLGYTVKMSTWNKV